MIKLSGDIYADLWVNKKTLKLGDDFAHKVYKHDDIHLSIRNRYFLTLLESFIKKNKNSVFINIAAGFTNYPFLVKPKCKFIEVDYRHVIEFKKNKIDKWQHENKLPNRKIEFFAVDLQSKKDHYKLENAMNFWIKDTPSYILLEGITYYLKMPILKQLFEIFRRVQSKDSIIGFDFWRPEIKKHPVFIRMQNYFLDWFGFEKQKYNLFNLSFLKNINGYKIEEITDVTKQEKIFSNTNIMQDYNNILPTDFCVLKHL
jgi:O-methyltransferase involved in polyketide biosynthesis